MSADLPILEALTEATQQAMKPLSLGKDDFLEIWMHENGDDFIMKPCTMIEHRVETHSGGFLPPAEISAIQERKLLTSEGGVKLVLSGRAPTWQAQQFLYRLIERTDLDPKRTGNRSGQFRVTATDFNCLMVHYCWPRDKLVFRGEESRAVFHYLIRRFLVQSMRANMQAKFKLENVVPELPSEFIDNDEYPLADYQKAALAFVLKSEGAALFMEQGTGKTAIAIQRICTEARLHRTGKLGNEPRMMRVLIVCPKQVRLNWQEEFGKFSTVPGKVSVCRGGKVHRLSILTHAIRQEEDCAFTAVVMNYETVVSDMETIGLIPWDLCILDESHYIKSYRSKRGLTVVEELRDVVERRMELTGTPIANTINDTFAQFEFLGKGLSGFKTIQNYKKFHSQCGDPKGKGATTFQRLNNFTQIPLFQERLARLSFRITKEEAGLQLPDKVRDVVEVDMTRTQRELYDRVASELAVEIKHSAGTSKMTTEHILTRLLRLAQITSGHIRTDPIINLDSGDLIEEGSVLQIPGGNPKAEETLRLIREDFEADPNQKIIVWSCFVEDIRNIGRLLTDEGIEHGLYFGATSESKREEHIHRFNNDHTFKVLIGNPATMGEGLNLLGYNPNVPEAEQAATYCGHEIFYAHDWSMIKRLQAEDRAHRRGTKMPVRITDIICPQSIDETKLHRVSAKIESANLLQDIEGILSEVLDLDLGESIV